MSALILPSRARSVFMAILLASAALISAPVSTIALSNAAGPNDIYVGASPAADGGESSCEEPDYSTDDDDIQVALSQALEDVNDDGDVVIICDGAYAYTGHFPQYVGGTGGRHPSVTIRAADAASVVLDGANDSYQLLNFAETDVTISGLVFADSAGSAIYATSELGGHTLRVEHSEFHGNHADYGAAIFTQNMDLSVVSSVFGALSDNEETGYYVETGNASSWDGGAIFVSGSELAQPAEIAINDSAFVGNVAEVSSGGAIIAEGEVRLTVSNSSFSANQAGVDVDGCGGAIYLHNVFGAHINNSTFTENEARYTGGAIASQTCQDVTHSGDPYTEAILVVRSSSFTGNSAFCAGGAIESLALRVSGSRFEANDAGECAGGAIASPGVRRGTPFELLGNRFIANTLDEPGGDACCHGGAVYLTYSNNDAGASPMIKANMFLLNTSDAFGGGLNLQGAMNVHGISRNTFSANSAVRGGGISLSACSFNLFPRRAVSELMRANRFRSNRAEARRESNVFRSTDDDCLE